MNRFIAACAITLAAGLTLANGTTSRPLDSQEMESVRGGCWVLTSLPCSGSTLNCSAGGCYTNTSGSFCTWGGLNWITASGSYSWFTTGNGLTSTKDGGQIGCGSAATCANTCYFLNGSLYCNLTAVNTYYQSQVVPTGTACAGS